MKLLIPFIFYIAGVFCFSQQPKHELWHTFLQTYVTNEGNVNYVKIRERPEGLAAYLNELKTVQPNDNWTKSQVLAYWINAYNAYTIQLIIETYPIRSIKSISNPWDEKFIPFKGNLISLNFIEHKILRKMNEPRIHFAIVCASVSCPKLQNEAITASNLEEQLTDATKEFLADPTKNELSKDTIKISKIFKWFKKDFEVNGSLIDFLNQYADITILASAKTSYKDYNWDLND